MVQSPLLFLKAREQARDPPQDEARALMDNLDILAAVARRACRRLRQGVFGTLLPPERQEVSQLFASAHGEMERLRQRLNEEEQNAGSIPTPSHP